MEAFEIAVIGGGLAGSIAALSFARKGFRTALVTPETIRNDARTSALMENSIGFLKALEIWDKVSEHATPLATMQIIDGTDRLLRAPTVAFRASEIGLEAFGQNIPNAPFLAILNEAMAAEPNLQVISAGVNNAVLGGEKAELTLTNGERIQAGLVVGADGRQSLIRKSAGIDVHVTNYPQTAVVLNFSHDLAHNNTSTEFHTATGPFTQVPLSGRRSSLVWVVTPQEAAALVDMTDEALNRRIETRMQSMLGKVRIETRPQAWPLSAMTAKHFGKHNAILIGEAAHVFPPIGAQGLNLSLRDIETAVGLAGEAKAAGRNLSIGDAYDRRRRADILTRTAGIDLLNRSLLSGFLPVQMLRAAGLQVLSSVAPLRHFLMQEGVSPGRALRGFPDFLRKKIDRKHA
ncbi:UbiH/UbiF family hydroxylase [Rhizobium sp. KVB221]|uniref:UbiH/UbiF family hydroxylase n=1 Tax=Rhizobium setariae TaxID=2801340 RepID=A0A937CQI1_9HYPH|nr:UbiH/UbiF family hydroxylase [Rhizobium setariae]MBL0373042.1 UbiH/UbiF family hydroxylase [Rhizobium setariae]